MTRLLVSLVVLFVVYVSLLAIGVVSLPFCFFTLGQLVNWLMQVQILISFV